MANAKPVISRGNATEPTEEERDNLHDLRMDIN